MTCYKKHLSGGLHLHRRTTSLALLRNQVILRRHAELLKIDSVLHKLRTTSPDPPPLYRAPVGYQRPKQGLQRLTSIQGQIRPSGRQDIHGCVLRSTIPASRHRRYLPITLNGEQERRLRRLQLRPRYFPILRRASPSRAKLPNTEPPRYDGLGIKHLN